MRPLSAYDFPAITRNVLGHAWRATGDRLRQGAMRTRHLARRAVFVLLAAATMGAVLVAVALAAVAQWVDPLQHDRLLRWFDD
jgi:hypothetical protein